MLILSPSSDDEIFVCVLQESPASCEESQWDLPPPVSLQSFSSLQCSCILWSTSVKVHVYASLQDL